MSHKGNKAVARLALLREGGNIRRYHAFPTPRGQTVADHSWHVAALLDAVMGDLLTLPLLRAAILHDVSEVATGDLPHGAKRREAKLKMAAREVTDAFELQHDLRVPLTQVEKEALAWADLAEAVLWMIEDGLMGNTYAWHILGEEPDLLQNRVTPPTMRARDVSVWACRVIVFHQSGVSDHLPDFRV
jgi:hypothetical protein